MELSEAEIEELFKNYQKASFALEEMRKLLFKDYKGALYIKRVNEDSDKISTIKAVRELTYLGLREAKILVDTAERGWSKIGAFPKGQQTESIEKWISAAGYSVEWRSE